MLKSVNLRDYMLKNPVTVKPTDNVFEAMKKISENKISGLCVIEGDGSLVGVLSEMDCLRAVLAAIYNEHNFGPVSDYMTAENLVIAHPGEDIVDVAEDMLRQNKRRRPVVENGKLIGQITIRQLLKAVAEFRATSAPH
ncbi:FOG: CBS domain protein [Luminiphilus syltensis NOR5-1B]|uniref:FOG: CBS domain protein n=1 Tax=Luminiphilus syltensis NOR5-1B TaxID=565045 RepID=B8KTG7_9GAMM|nr:CBS domain-containing protein [Luminiphilus syltensis]EED35565.1 FOG: CBS domain protein [Luminiphilus syltensis NOR5-1B]